MKNNKDLTNKELMEFLAGIISKAEGKKVQTSIGNIREIISILISLEAHSLSMFIDGNDPDGAYLAPSNIIHCLGKSLFEHHQPKDEDGN